MTDSTAVIVAAIASGAPLPPGELWFTAPLVIGEGKTLRGAGRDRTVLRPLPNAGGPMIVIGQVWTGLRGGIEDLTLKGSGALDSFNELGIVVRGNGLRFRNVVVTQCRYGVTLESSVDVSFYDCMFWYNVCNVHSVGDGTGTISVTSTRFHDCVIRDATWSGCYIQQGWGLLFDACIIESNKAAGIEIQSYPLANPLNFASVDPVSVRDTWIENNPGGPIVAWNANRTARVDISPAFVIEYNVRRI